MPGPYEPPGGQDDDAPDLGLALLATIALLHDLRHHLDESAEADDLTLRVGAVLHVLDRLRQRS